MWWFKRKVEDPFPEPLKCPRCGHPDTWHRYEEGRCQAMVYGEEYVGDDIWRETRAWCKCDLSRADIKLTLQKRKEKASCQDPS